MRHAAVEDGGLHLQPEKICVVREECRIEVGFYGGQIDSVVFQAGMVAHHQKSQQREEKNARQFERKALAFQSGFVSGFENRCNAIRHRR